MSMFALLLFCVLASEAKKSILLVVRRSSLPAASLIITLEGACELLLKLLVERISCDWL